MLALDSFEKNTRTTLALGSSEKLAFSLALH